MTASTQERFRIYKSSAGSGKTFTLVLEYLKIALRSPLNYRHILAITFTNKAAGEMKFRIISALSGLSKGGEKNLRELLLPELKMNDGALTERASAVLSNILHDYNNFGVSTIDSFTHKIVRTFARDLEIPSGYDVETDTRGLLATVTDQLMDNIGRDDYITDILTRFAESNIEEGDSWYVEKPIKEISEKIFDEGSENAVEKLAAISEDDFHELIGELKEKRKPFQDQMNSLAKEALDLIDSKGLSIDDFKYKATGPANTFRKLLNAKEPKEFSGALSGKRWQAALENDDWAGKGPNQAKVEQALDQGLRDLAGKIQNYYDEHYQEFSSAWFSFKNIYSLAVLGQVKQLTADYQERNNIVHISEFNKRIAELLKEEPPEFIYWRLGEKYHHFLVDEFQDTSLRQWMNLLPLFENVVAGGENKGSLVFVGDSKQAIYRWRGGEVELLENIAPAFTNTSPQNLDTNYRSDKAVIGFNNDLFTSIGEYYKTDPLIASVYENPGQKLRPGLDREGFVRLKFFDKDDDLNFREQALEEVEACIQEALNDRFNYRDMAILVRTKHEGSLLASQLSKQGIPVISSDSLILNRSPKVSFLVSVLQYLQDPSDAFARLEIWTWLSLYGGREDVDWLKEWTSAIENHQPKSPDDYSLPDYPDPRPHFPEAWKILESQREKLSLYELVERVVRIFGLNDPASAYVQHFMDRVLRFGSKRRSDLSAFLEDWAEKAEGLTLNVPEGENAIRILTIHKAKGLQFPIVFVPFANWRLKPKSNSLVWGRSEGLGKSADTFILKFQNELESSGFGEDIRQEINLSLLDNINLLYVALTRPESRLYLFCQNPSKKIKDDPSNISYLLRFLIESGEFKNSLSTVDDMIYEKGIPEPKSGENVEATAETVEKMISNDWGKKIMIRESEGNDKDEVDWLSIIKDALRMIGYGAKIQKAVNTLFHQGKLDSDQSTRLADFLEIILKDEKIGKRFLKPSHFQHDAKLRSDSGTLSVDFISASTSETYLLNLTDQKGNSEKILKEIRENIPQNGSIKPEIEVLVLEFPKSAALIGQGDS